MLRSAASKVMWVGRATVFLVGLAMILALVFGVATTALGANLDNFILGKANNSASKVTGLVSNVTNAAQSALLVRNSGPGSALDLRVGNTTANPADKTTPPMKVDSQAQVANLNAQFAGTADDALHADTADSAADAGTLDGLDSTGFIRGDGDAIRGTRAFAPGESVATLVLSNLVQRPTGLRLQVSYLCPSDLTSDGTVNLHNYSGETLNVFSDNGGANPNDYVQLDHNQIYSQPASASGEHITFSVQGNGGMATVEVVSVHRADDCHAQAQGLFTY